MLSAAPLPLRLLLAKERYISPISPLYLPYISPISRLYLPYSAPNPQPLPLPLTRSAACCPACSRCVRTPPPRRAAGAPYLPYISVYLPYISRVSPVYLPTAAPSSRRALAEIWARYRRDIGEI